MSWADLPLYVLLVIALHVALAAASAMAPVPEDLLGPGGRQWLETVLRASVEGLATGLTAAVAVVAAAAGVEVRAQRRAMGNGAA